MRRQVKRAVRPLLAPVMRRLQMRIDAGVRRAEVRLDEVERRLAVIAPDVEALRGYTPIVMDVIASQNATAREMRRSSLDRQKQIADLWERLEFVRRELMFEHRYGAGSRGEAASDRTPEVVDPQRLADAGKDIRLNLGCGHVPLPDYLNVDSRRLPGVDIVADIAGLPFGPGEVSEVFSAHLLEHFPVEQLKRSLLPYWFRLLRPGGALVAVVPDSETMLAEHAAGRVSFDELREVTFGGQEYDGDFHFNMFSKESLCHLLQEVGFVDVAVRVDARRNGLCYEMEVAGFKPGEESATGA